MLCVGIDRGILKCYHMYVYVHYYASKYFLDAIMAITSHYAFVKLRQRVRQG